MEKILLNSIQTPDGTILISRHVHDYVSYTDKNGQHYSVDGGSCYIRRGFDVKDYKELSIFDDGSHITRRETINWGVSYDKKMKRLPQTQWKKIMDLETDHIKSIIEGGFVANNSFLKEVFENELKYRENGHI